VLAAAGCWCARRFSAPKPPLTAPPPRPHHPPQVSLPTQYNGKNQDPVGALSSALARLQANRPLRELREVAKGLSKQLPQPLQVATSKIDEYARGMISGSGSTLFEELGLYYIGPVDGHNIDDLIAVLSEVKAAETVRLLGGRAAGGWGGWGGWGAAGPWRRDGGAGSRQAARGVSP
jgi:hypothetical protein